MKGRQFWLHIHGLSLGSIVLICALMQSCAVKGPPAWTRQMPSDNDYYVGVGSAGKAAGGSDHIARARDIALEQIAAGIAVTITGQTTQHMLEQEGLVKESFQYTIQSWVRGELEGYERVDSWENEHEYWVMYRLSKARHRMLLDSKKQAASAQAAEWHTRGRNEWGQGNITAAIQYLLTASQIIGTYKGMGLSASDASMDIKIRTDLRDILSAITIHCHPSEIQPVLPGTTVGKSTIQVQYTWPDGKQIPVNGMPLAVTPDQGNGTFSQPLPTDGGGISVLEIHQASGQEMNRWMVSPDLKALATHDNTEGRYELNQLPSCLVTLEAAQTRVMVMAREYNLDKPVSPLIVAGQLKQYLTSGGWMVVNEAHLADYLLTINAAASHGVERQGIHTAFARGDFAVINNQTMEEVVKKTFINISGGGLNYESAGQQALTNLGEKMVEEFRDAWK